MFVKFVLPLCLAVLICGFFYIALSDVPVTQHETRKIIPNDRFFGK